MQDFNGKNAWCHGLLCYVRTGWSSHIMHCIYTNVYCQLCHHTGPINFVLSEPTYSLMLLC